MTYYHRIILYFDGASRHNPRGPAGCGWVLYEMDRNGAKGDWIAEDSAFLGYNISNNQAEYAGLSKGLQYLVNNGIECHGLYVRGDSEIVINQINGDYGVRSYNIMPYYQRAIGLLTNQIDCTFYSCRHVYRGENWEADELANSAIDDNCFDYY